MKLKTKLEKLDDELLFKSFDLSVGEKKIQTPFKAGQRKLPAGQINEIYKKFSLDRLEKVEADNEEERKLNSLLKAESSDGINLCFVDCESQDNIKRKHIEALADLSYPYSDIIVTPLWSSTIRDAKTKGETVQNEFIKLTNDYIEIIETMNNKSIVGLVPAKMPRNFLDTIVDNYNDKGVTNFAINFDGLSVESSQSWFRKLLRILKTHGLEEKALLYSINSAEGRFYKQAQSVVAKDFIGLGYGIDILGLNHIPPRMNSEAWAKIKAQRAPMAFRQFNRQSYGYERITETEMKRRFTDKSGLKKFNVVEQFNETSAIREKLGKEHSLEPYLRGKSSVDAKTVDKIKKMRKETFRK